MRKGIEIIIDNLHRNGLQVSRYEEYLISSALSLKVIDVINGYYYCLCTSRTRY